MGKSRSAFLCVLLFLLCGRFVFPNDAPSSLADEFPERSAGETVKHILIGSAETIFSNLIVLSVNVLYSEAYWAVPTSSSIRANFTSPWQWEPYDDFMANQLGHPVQGSMYFSAGRVNGFNFYESALFSVLGSYTWEAFGEAALGSINDLITTVSSSLSIGEMIYRIYLEACASGMPKPLAFLFNPMAGFHRLITRWEPPNHGRNLYELSAYLGIGYSQIYSSASTPDSREELFSFRGLWGDIGVSVIYGNPFEQYSRVPYEHFELDASVGMNPGKYLSARIVSDGYLFSFSPVYSEKDTMSTGLSLHFDYVMRGKFDPFNSTIDQHSNALDWTVKYRHKFSADTVFETKLHAGFNFLGSSEYYSAGNIPKYYGPGINVKCFFSMENKTLGKFKVSVFNYLLWSYPGTSDLSRANVHWLFADFTYSHSISKHFSLGISDSFIWEQGSFGDFPQTRKTNNEIKMFVAWNL